MWGRKTYDGRGRWIYTHEHFHRAGSGLDKLLSQNTLFTGLEDPAYPSTNQ